MTPVRLDPAASRSRVKYSTTEPLRLSEVVPCEIDPEGEIHFRENLLVLWGIRGVGIWGVQAK